MADKISTLKNFKIEGKVTSFDVKGSFGLVDRDGDEIDSNIEYKSKNVSIKVDSDGDTFLLSRFVTCRPAQQKQYVRSYGMLTFDEIETKTDFYPSSLDRFKSGDTKISTPDGYKFCETIEEKLAVGKYYSFRGEISLNEYMKDGRKIVSNKFEVQEIVEIEEPDDLSTLEKKATVDYYFNKQTKLDDGRIVLSGGYLNYSKENGIVKYKLGEMPLTIDPEYLKNKPKKVDKVMERYSQIFKVENDYYKHIRVNMLLSFRSKNAEFTEDLLTEEDKLDLEIGLVTFEDLQKSYGDGKTEISKDSYLISIVGKRKPVSSDFDEEYFKGEEVDMSDFVDDDEEDLEDQDDYNYDEDEDVFGED